MATKKHNGRTAIPEYEVWCGMIQRCTNPKHISFRNYGAKAVQVCARWRESFDAFFADVGPRPSRAHRLDRFPNGQGNYEPGNCRWATRSEEHPHEIHHPVCLVSHRTEAQREYGVWAAMIRRCENKNAKEFPAYGGKGIKVCQRWRESFDAFIEDMGHRPSPKHQLDRFPNRAGNYEPGNVRWATCKENNRNRRDNVRIAFQGETLTAAEWSERTGIDVFVIYQRFCRLKWPAEKTLTTPLKPMANREAYSSGWDTR